MAKKPEPPQPTSWNIYKVAKKAVWLGTVEAPEKDAAIRNTCPVSEDANQKYIFDINQNNAKVEIIDREAGKVVSSFGRVGQLPGEFNQIHGIATDTNGNIYLAENRGRRVLKFHPVGQ